MHAAVDHPHALLKGYSRFHASGDGYHDSLDGRRVTLFAQLLQQCGREEAVPTVLQVTGFEGFLTRVHRVVDDESGPPSRTGTSPINATLEQSLLLVHTVVGVLSVLCVHD